ncbi:MAG: ribose-phosphate pyrophosphokinae [Thermoanaerobacteraceae bacterium]|jgi:ribose-phosphate pyrophosphokinase|uniref:Ribose-phosphate pyrophosphokinase n=1 Tax=Biomaibacter acetigenes TaxID=2316383 RepID=A0A3G2R1I9_9FIRM|nr:ribose-phosphate pyrophosphokinase [Biomaibacter acetigenes]MDK2878556.1 ribose-phosphate pyrophosphokinae [Thermoanaerobacteraceae bacterium]RKL64611.1 ribose-phosphate pyrophosphokinase [Thermoanaerobacteraceae bacterium SP2]AYO29290.1 ribose-phosphate diphosphokinase [Biomaibacter acetigenes]MDN5301575.1 ribose-phosphate pyrophosphokinae [Thermoanaerobacteraceae bacterium]MDN5312126.1 ribose-phosphate pyrophosphokinae [Thermoanaerobacteraceae bacterium]
MDNRLEIFTGNANPELAREIADNLGITLGDSVINTFSDGEIQVKINESVRGADVFVVQPFSSPVNDHIMELLIMIDAFKRASAWRITAVIPYYGYARQDRKVRPRDPITAKLVADIISAAGAHRVLTMDLHAGQIQGYFNFPVDHLMAVPILADYFKKKELGDIAVVSPDLGGVTRARELANRIGASIAIIDKRRPEPNVAEVMNIIGKVEGKTVIMTDDMIDTAGTITLGAEALLERGAKAVYACCTHPVLSGPAIERLQQSPIEEVVVTNTIRLKDDKKIDKIKVLSVAPLFAAAISRIHENMSVSTLFD